MSEHAAKLADAARTVASMYRLMDAGQEVDEGDFFHALAPIASPGHALPELSTPEAESAREQWALADSNESAAVAMDKLAAALEAVNA